MHRTDYIREVYTVSKKQGMWNGTTVEASSNHELPVVNLSRHDNDAECLNEHASRETQRARCGEKNHQEANRALRRKDHGR